jgi:uncharacterized membrane protein (UPF0127 family)
MSARRRVVLGALLACFGAGLLALALYAITRPDDDADALPASLRALLAGAKPAGEPFPALTELRLGVGGRCLRVVVADTDDERARGLMARTDLGDYDGMLFVVPRSSENAFTMSGTRVPLDIGWYRADGTRGNTAQMVVCRDTIENCPVYRPEVAWRFALETLHGELPSGDLAPCA